jgi:hypothetical protein
MTSAPATSSSIRFVVADERSRIAANAGALGVGGPRGLLVGDVLLLELPLSRFFTVSGSRTPPDVEFYVPDLNQSGLDAGFTDPTASLRERCAARSRAAAAGSLMLKERDGLPPAPGGALTADAWSPATDRPAARVAGAPPFLGVDPFYEVACKAH